MSELKKNLSKVEIIGYLFVGVITVSILGYCQLHSSDKPESAKSLVETPVYTEQREPKPIPEPAPLETKKQYISSTKKIGDKQSPVYFKEFLKNPEKFNGRRLNVIGKIFDISETDGKSFLQVYITRDYSESAIVIYQGSIPFYKDDMIRIYGEGAGKISGPNVFGAEMEWPVILAKYIEKHHLEE